MECKVLAVRKTFYGHSIAHVSVDGMFGDVPASDGVAEGVAEIQTRIAVVDGRLVARLRVEAVKAN